MDMQRLKAMNKYWESMPPTHVLVKRLGIALGVEKATGPRAQEQDPFMLLTGSDSGAL